MKGWYTLYETVPRILEDVEGEVFYVNCIIRMPDGRFEVGQDFGADGAGYMPTFIRDTFEEALADAETLT